VDTFSKCDNKGGIKLNSKKRTKKIGQLITLLVLMQMTDIVLARDDALGPYVVGSAGVGISEYDVSGTKNDLIRNYGWSSADVTQAAGNQILTIPTGFSYVYPFMFDLLAFEGGLKNLGKVDATFKGTDANSGSVHGTEKSDPLALYVAGVGRLPLGSKDFVFLVRGGVAVTVTSINGSVESLQGSSLVTKTYSTGSTHTAPMYGFGIEKIFWETADAQSSKKFRYFELGFNMDYFDTGTKLGIIKTYMLTLGFPSY
jgi:hypothetical protein